MTIFGSSALSVSAVRSVFLGGIALGSYFGGKVIANTINKYRLTGFALIILGLFCLSTPLIFSLIDHPFYLIKSFVSNPVSIN